jgi:hypothetical protein
VYCGAQATFADNGKLAPFDLSSPLTLLSSLRNLITPAVEVQHRATLLEALLGESQRAAIRNVLEDIRSGRQANNNSSDKTRERALRPFDPLEIPPHNARGKPNERKMRVWDVPPQSGLLRRRMTLAQRRRLHMEMNSDATRDQTNAENMGSDEGAADSPSAVASPKANPPSGNVGPNSSFVLPPRASRCMLGEGVTVGRRVAVRHNQGGRANGCSAPQCIGSE